MHYEDKEKVLIIIGFIYFILFAVILLSFYCYNLGIDVATSNIRKEAIQAGVAEYTTDKENASPIFQFIKCQQ